jgi:hypothetical protein
MERQEYSETWQKRDESFISVWWISVLKTEEQIKAHFKGLVAYFDINLNLK